MSHLLLCEANGSIYASGGTSGSRMDQGQASSAGSQEIGHDPDPLHLHSHGDREPACQSCARVTVIDAEGASGRACRRHAVASLKGITVAGLTGPTLRPSTSGNARPWNWPKNEANSGIDYSTLNSAGCGT